MFRPLVRLVMPGSRVPQVNPREDPRSLDDGTPAGAGPRLVALTATGVDGSLESLAGTRATAEYPGSSEGPRREAVATVGAQPGAVSEWNASGGAAVWQDTELRRKGGIDNSVSFRYNGVMSELKGKLDTGRVRLRAVTPGVARERAQVATDSGMYNDFDTPRRITAIEEQLRETSGCLKEALLPCGPLMLERPRRR